MLFSAPMVHALLSGRKTQTRRIVKGQALEWLENGFTPGFTADPGNYLSPYGYAGDRLWVKETWRPRASLQPWDLDVRYAADGAERTIKDGEFGERDWTMPKAAATGNVSPLFMPRWASRLTLDITGVRIERLKEISAADCYAEGCERPSGPQLGSEVCRIDNARGDYRRIWEAINGAGSWAENPWVWVVSFRVLDALGASASPIPGGYEPKANEPNNPSNREGV